jgi:hypothetical protein
MPSGLRESPRDASAGIGRPQTGRRRYIGTTEFPLHAEAATAMSKGPSPAGRGTPFIKVGRNVGLSRQRWRDRSPSSRQVRRPVAAFPVGGPARAGPEDAVRSLPPARTRQCVRVTRFLEGRPDVQSFGLDAGRMRGIAYGGAARLDYSPSQSGNHRFPLCRNGTQKNPPKFFCNISRFLTGPIGRRAGEQG